MALIDVAFLLKETCSKAYVKRVDQQPGLLDGTAFQLATLGRAHERIMHQISRNLVASRCTAMMRASEPR